MEQNLGQTDIPAPKILLQPYMPRQSEGMGHGNIVPGTQRHPFGSARKMDKATPREQWRRDYDRNGSLLLESMPGGRRVSNVSLDVPVPHHLQARAYRREVQESSDANSDLSISQVTELVDKLNMSGQGMKM